MARRHEKTNEELRQELEIHEHDLQAVAYEIHDGFAQHATAALLYLEAFHKNMQYDPDEAWRNFHAALELLRLGISESRRLINGLRPLLLEEFGLKAAIDGLVAETQAADGPQVELCVSVNFHALPLRLEHVIYRIIQECLTNARKHSKSKRVEIGLAQEGDRLRLEVKDWGVGFETARIQPDCVGLEGIRLRVKSMGGRATIVSIPGQGTTIRVELPVAHEQRQKEQRLPASWLPQSKK